MAEAGDMDDADRNERRILRLLARTDARMEPASMAGAVLLDGGEWGVVSAPRGIVEGLATRGLIVIDGGLVSIASDRRSQRPPVRPADAAAGEGRQIELAEIAGPEGAIVVPVNLAESPLGMLARRRGRDGKPFLSGAEWRAGERFRSDYTRGQIMPRLGANWVATVSSGRRGAAGGAAELTEAALAARFRVEKAVEAVGPELSGVLIDVCCFLKGLELVETERGWPVRSAKVVLKTALAALARHYDPGSGRAARKPAHALHWGAEGYRPTIGGASGE
jgi:hypothetical protein